MGDCLWASDECTVCPGSLLSPPHLSSPPYWPQLNSTLFQRHCKDFMSTSTPVGLPRSQNGWLDMDGKTKPTNISPKHQLSHFALLSRLLHGTRSSLVFISSMLSWKESDWLGYDKRRTQASHVCDTYFILHWSASMLLYHIPLIQDSLCNTPTLQERKGSHSFFNKVNMVLYDREKQTDKKEGSLFSQSEFWNGHSLILSL